jgi:hypothetical protein
MRTLLKNILIFIISLGLSSTQVFALSMSAEKAHPKFHVGIGYSYLQTPIDELDSRVEYFASYMKDFYRNFGIKLSLHHLPAENGQSQSLKVQRQFNKAQALLTKSTVQFFRWTLGVGPSLNISKTDFSFKDETRSLWKLDPHLRIEGNVDYSFTKTQELGLNTYTELNPNDLKFNFGFGLHYNI